MRFPKKNLFMINGRTLIEHAVISARAIAEPQHIFVSSEDTDILEEALACGVQPLYRPMELATSTASAKNTLLHAIDTLEKGGLKFDTCAYLQPTSPLRQKEDVQSCMALYQKSGADMVISVTESELAPGRFWKLKEKMVPYLLDANPFTRRQDQDKAYIPNGAVYVVNAQAFKSSSSNMFVLPGCRAYIMPPIRSIDIDTRFDAELASLLFSRQLEETFE